MTSTESEDVIKPTVTGPMICRALASVIKRNFRIKQRTKLWYTTRVMMITCSDMASVLGENPYSNRKSVFRKKTGQSRPFKGNFATRRGTELEDVAIKAYEKKTGKKVWGEDVGLLQHLDWPQIGGSPDGITTDGVLVEVKCPLTRPIISGFCPPQYVAQVQVLMEICDLETAHFVQYKPSSVYTHEILDVTVMKRDREYFANALPQLLSFMADVNAFYNQVGLPIGTPMIDWEKEDAKALAALKTDQSIGIGKVCAFVTNPETQMQQFVVEEYTGIDKPVTRTVHDLITGYESNNDEVKHADAVVDKLKSEKDTIDIDIQAIIAQLPARYRPVTGRKRGHSDPVFDVDAIQMAMKKQHTRKQ